MQKILIIEGVDCSGKDYLIEMLSKKRMAFNDRYKSLVIKSNIIPKNKDESRDLALKSISIIDAFKTLEYELIIMNRFVLSELVYSSVKRDYKASECWEYMSVIKQLNNHDVLCVILNPSFEIVKTRLVNRGDEYINEDDIEKIKEKYIYYKNHIKNTVVCSGQDTALEVINKWLIF